MTAARSVGIMATFVVDFVDVLFISRLGDTRLVAAVGFSAAALFFIRAIAIALGIATTALVAQAVGSGNGQRAARYAFNLSLLSFVLMTTIAAAVWLGRGTVLSWVGASGETLHFASGYLGIVLIGLPLLSLGNCGTATLFALGSARLAMLVSLSATLTQAALDPVFIFVLGWGLRGAGGGVCAGGDGGGRLVLPALPLPLARTAGATSARRRYSRHYRHCLSGDADQPHQPDCHRLRRAQHGAVR